jgi:hypothetical protein
MTEPFFNEIRKRPEFQAELVVALEEELTAMMKEMEAKDAEIAALKKQIDDMKSCDTCKYWQPTCSIMAACSNHHEKWEAKE